jgi:hypothetical protein
LKMGGGCAKFAGIDNRCCLHDIFLNDQSVKLKVFLL